MATSRPIARYKDLCIDTGASERLGRFWSGALGLAFESDEEPGSAGVLTGPTSAHRIWMNDVPEPRTVKHRVHIDLFSANLDDLIALGASVLVPQTPDRHWTVLTDPEGGEFCAFLRDPANLPEPRLKDLVIDCEDPRELGAWWAGVFDVPAEWDADQGYCWIDGIPGFPYESWDFVPVPEAKSAKNRIHWDVLVDSVDELVAAGATVLRAPTEDDRWTVLADPEGNEFCAFTMA
jgi:predicted enzyme related to lactoylglutathione lyase